MCGHNLDIVMRCVKEHRRSRGVGIENIEVNHEVISVQAIEDIPVTEKRTE